MVESQCQLLDLPPELLIRISQFAIKGQREGAMTPLFLGKICRDWRSLIFESSEFWTALRLTLRSNPESQLELLEEWGNRAAGHPLHITISDPSAVLTEGDPPCERLIRWIQDKSPKISRLKLLMTTEFFDAMEDSKMAEYMWPLLTKVSLDSDGWDLTNPHGFLNFGPQTCPQLTSATIGKFRFYDIQLPWKSLLHLHLCEGVYPEDIRGVLRMATQLQTLKSSSVYNSYTSALGTHGLTTVITNSSLNQFTFSSDEANLAWGCEVFNSLCLPELKTLTIKRGQKRPIARHTFEFDIYPLIFQSKFPLVQLSVEFTALQEPRFLDCLFLLPSLVILRLCSNSWFHEDPDNLTPLRPDLFISMMGSEKNTPIMPNLEEVILEGSVVSFSPEILMKLLKDRWGDTRGNKEKAALRSIVLSLEGSEWEIEKRHQVEFEGWREKGFTLDVR
ncbi:hypothetical protein D9611_013628 [Ephemerocybe angulata]|uniref:F-box domain-containing protein n=1 Tax=Ephemerocybe angulata TaxID=980116 RepID=A0A8H5ERU4_9AGAR|nr:hypothetical protein D9611_013628 [Tulosesus angulatus]